VGFIIVAVGFLSVRQWKEQREGVGPGPKTLPQTSKNGVYERLVGVEGEKGLENVNVNGSFDGEKVCVGSNGDICNGIFQLQFGRPWKGNGRFGPFCCSHRLLVVRSPQVVLTKLQLKPSFLL
jgi:hypothetical protein